MFLTSLLPPLAGLLGTPPKPQTCSDRWASASWNVLHQAVHALRRISESTSASLRLMHL